MSKLVYAVMSVVILEFALYLFGGTTVQNTTLLGLLLNPTESNLLWVAFIAAVSLGITSIIASAFYQINTFGIYAILVGGIMTFGVTIFNFYTYIRGALTDYGLSSAPILASLAVMPLLIFYVAALLEWTRSNS